ncbi:MAG: hypothetical protein QM528_06340 [Phycisphaerales bacterium]|nr:hypothetical protein [Phycisphaerales bacterium]
MNATCKLFVLLCTVFFYFPIAHATHPENVYKIGKKGYFNTIQQGLDYLYDHGIRANTTLELTDPNYVITQPIVFKAIRGLEKYRLTLTNSPNQTTVIYGVGQLNYLVKIDTSVANLTITGSKGIDDLSNKGNMTWYNQSSLDSSVCIRIDAGGLSAPNNLEISNTILKGNNNTTATGIQMHGNYIRNVVIKNNQIYNTAYAISIDGSACNNFKILDNWFGTDSLEYVNTNTALAIQGVDGLVINHNLINNMYQRNPFAWSNFWCCGILLGSGVQHARVVGNTIVNLNHFLGNVSAITLERENGNIQISNNVITKLQAYNEVSGIYILGASQQVTISYNTIRLTDTNKIGDETLYMNLGVQNKTVQDISIVNNVFSNKVFSGFNVMLFAPDMYFPIFDYNQFDAPYGYLLFDDEYLCTTLLSLQLRTGGNHHTQIGDPMFISSDYLMPQAASPLIKKAVPIDSIRYDIVENQRDRKYPTIGAYEYMTRNQEPPGHVFSIKKIYPVPFESNIALVFDSIPNQPVELSIFTQGGLMVGSKPLLIKPKQSTITMDMPNNLPKGIYYLRVKVGTETQSFSITK